MIDLFDELTRVTAALDAAGIEYALIGGLAYSIWVEPRATEDIDFLVYPDDWLPIQGALEPLGFRDLSGPRSFKDAEIRRLVRIETKDVVVVDFFLADASTASGVRDRCAVTSPQGRFWLARPSMIVYLKERRRSSKDIGDIEGLSKIPDPR